MSLEITAETSESEHARQRLESALQAAWDTILLETFTNLADSIER
jgi:hypothetical protein